MENTIENNLGIEILNRLSRIENKIDNFQGFEKVSFEEKKELNSILKEKELYSYDEVFN